MLDTLRFTVRQMRYANNYCGVNINRRYEAPCCCHNKRGHICAYVSNDVLGEKLLDIEKSLTNGVITQTNG